MNTREIILEILGKEWPLSSKQVHNLILRHYKKQVSYHTVYEIIQDLVDKQIITKKQKAYLLNKKWLDMHIKELKNIQESYNRNQPLKIVNKESAQIQVQSLAELMDFIFKNYENYFFSEKHTPFFMKVKHPWGGFYTEKDIPILKKAFQKESIILASKNTLLDRAISKFYKKLGVQIILGAHEQTEEDNIVIGDCVIKIYFPEELRQELENIFQMKTALDLRKIRKAKHIYDAEHTINIVIIRNKNIADMIRKEIQNAITVSKHSL